MFKQFKHSSYREKETPYVEGYFESNHIFMNICHKIHLCAIPVDDSSSAQHIFKRVEKKFLYLFKRRKNSTFFPLYIKRQFKWSRIHSVLRFFYKMNMEWAILLWMKAKHNTGLLQTSAAEAEEKDFGLLNSLLLCNRWHLQSQIPRTKTLQSISR